MALITRVTDRYPAQRLLELTNPKNTAAVAINTTILQVAADDAQAEFEASTGIAYDDTSALHQSVASQGVIVYLHRYKGTSKTAGRQDQDLWNEGLEKVKLVSGNNRVDPTDNSNLEPTREEGSTPIRPAFDPTHFSSLQLRPPRTG